jgi:hypothetical protein
VGKYGIHRGEKPRDTVGPAPDGDGGRAPRAEAAGLWTCGCGLANADHQGACEFCGHPRPVVDLPDAKVHVTGAGWTLESRVYHALVCRLGGTVCLSRGELEPGPECGLVLQTIEGDGIAMRSDTLNCRPPRRVVERHRDDPDFHNLCSCLRDLVREGRFSPGDLFDAVMVARALGAEVEP